MRIMVVQCAGDLREAYGRWKQGGLETYRHQWHTVDTVVNLAENFNASIATVVFHTSMAYREQIAPNVEAIGMGYSVYPRDFTRIQDTIREWNPTHVIFRFLPGKLLDWCSRQNFRMLVVAEDMLPSGGFKNWWRNRRVARVLNRPAVEWAAHIHLNASRWFVEIGVKPERVIPYDYEELQSPDQFPVREMSQRTGKRKLAFVGSVTDGKGVPDLIGAVAELSAAGYPVDVRIAGDGDIESCREHAKRLQIADSVTFLGRIPNSQVIELLRDSDAMVVPSRHTYSESFGLVVQESFLARTPVITSNHKAFNGRVVDGETGLVFPAGNTKALATQVRRLFDDPTLYRKLSENSLKAWERMQIPARWKKVIHSWLQDTPESREWLRAHAWSTGRYDPNAIPKDA